jgi:hypothetical protein
MTRALFAMLNVIILGTGLMAQETEATTVRAKPHADTRASAVARWDGAVGHEPAGR